MDASLLPLDVRPADLQARYTREDLIRLSGQSIDAILALIRDLPDAAVTFQPEDPDAHDEWAATPEEVTMAWTLAHVIAHVTASAEERAAHGSMLARGVEIRGRCRYEVPWWSLTTLDDLVARLEESRRMRLAFLETWPDRPHLDNVFNHKSYIDLFGLMNPVGMVLFGLQHEVEHLPQIAEIVRQARAALT